MKDYLKNTILLTALLSLFLSGCSPESRNAVLTKSVQISNKSVNLNDPSLYKQWDIFRTNTSKAWMILNQKKQIRVAVVDTGVDYNHPDLKNRVLKDLGYNFVNNNEDTMDDNWHGTHVAGIIAAEGNNQTGIIGIAGLADVKIIPVKVMDENGEGSSDIIAEGIKYAADIGVDIINFSIGFNVKDKYIENAIKYAKNKGAFVVVSAGNDGVNCDISSPASDEGSYTVASVNGYDERSSFSNFGNSVKIAAPGENILSTVPNGSYEYKDGTSMAAPIVTGVAAMVKAENPNLTPDEIEDILNYSAEDVLNRGKDEDTGYGVVDAYEAVKTAKSFEKRWF